MSFEDSSCAIASTSYATSSTEHRTIQARLETRYVPAGTVEAQASRVSESLRAVSATRRKLSLVGQQCEDGTSGTPEDEFILMQAATINAMLADTLCPKCRKNSVGVNYETRLGLAVKMVLSCSACGSISSHWSSQRKEDSRVFDVNIRSMQAIKTIGKGQTALNDLWATMNVSHRGLHHKTYQGHLKQLFKPAAEVASDKVFADAVVAVKRVYREMDTGFLKMLLLSSTAPG